MVGLLGHRQTKGTATDNDKPNATAPHLYSTDSVRLHRKVERLKTDPKPDLRGASKPGSAR
jgi:hypothetical protein